MNDDNTAVVWIETEDADGHCTNVLSKEVPKADALRMFAAASSDDDSTEVYRASRRIHDVAERIVTEVNVRFRISPGVAFDAHSTL